jgi:predicted DNA binding CopG/RHH family protein
MSKIPKFQNEEEESSFWESHELTDFLEDTVPTNFRFVGPRPRKVLISLRFDQETIDKLKVIAEHKGLGYQTLIRMWVIEQLAKESEESNALRLDHKSA